MDKTFKFFINSLINSALIVGDIFWVAWDIHTQSYVWTAIFAFLLVGLISIRETLDHEKTFEAIKKAKLKK